MTDRPSRPTITPLHPFLGARVEGVDLDQPMDEPTFRAIFDAFQGACGTTDASSIAGGPGTPRGIAA